MEDRVKKKKAVAQTSRLGLFWTETKEYYAVINRKGREGGEEQIYVPYGMVSKIYN